MWEAIIHPRFLEHLQYWTRAQPRTALKVLELVEMALRDPFGGPGKPERLRHTELETWSRRITEEHRITYVVDRAEHRLYFVGCRRHYRDT